MKALHRPPRAHPRSSQRGLRAFAAPAAVIALGSAITIASFARDAVGTSAASPARDGTPHGVALWRDANSRDADGPFAARRWPAEIEQLLSSEALLGDAGGALPTVETDQRCSRVEDGLAHCVMLECQTAGGQTACFEMVVTARRLGDAPDVLRDGSDDELPDPFDEQSVHPISSL